MEDSGILNPLNSKPQGRCLTFFTPKKWLRTSSKSLFILKFKSTVLLSQNSYKIPKSPRSYVGEHASARGSLWGGKHWWQRSSMEATCCHVWARASTKTRSSRVVCTCDEEFRKYIRCEAPLPSAKRDRGCSRRLAGEVERAQPSSL